MKTLHLTLHRHWFVEILSGRKTTEYRQINEFWRKRLEGREYDIVRFRNGYAKDAPWMEVEYLGVDIDEFRGEIVYGITLGRILRSGRTECLSQESSRNSSTAGLWSVSPA